MAQGKPLYKIKYLKLTDSYKINKSSEALSLPSLWCKKKLICRDNELKAALSKLSHIEATYVLDSINRKMKRLLVYFPVE